MFLEGILMKMQRSLSHMLVGKLHLFQAKNLPPQKQLESGWSYDFVESNKLTAQ